MDEEQRVEEQRVEMRQVERMHLVFYLRVFDGMGSKVLGHIVDISSKGVMLISDSPIPVNESFRLRMRLPSEIANKDELIFNAISRWCKQDANPDFYITGFEIYDVDEEVAKYILCLIDDFSFHDPS
jgi:hypothetical protein